MGVREHGRFGFGDTSRAENGAAPPLPWNSTNRFVERSSSYNGKFIVPAGLLALNRFCRNSLNPSPCPKNAIGHDE